MNSYLFSITLSCNKSIQCLKQPGYLPCLAIHNEAGNIICAGHREEIIIATTFLCNTPSERVSHKSFSHTLLIMGNLGPASAFFLIKAKRDLRSISDISYLKSYSGKKGKKTRSAQLAKSIRNYKYALNHMIEHDWMTIHLAYLQCLVGPTAADRTNRCLSLVTGGMY